MFAEGIIEKPKWDHEYYVKDGGMLMAVYEGRRTNWQNCREIFHEHMEGANDLRFFLKPTLPLDEVARFMLHLEKLMGIEPQSVIHRARYKVKIEKKTTDPEYDGSAEDGDDPIAGKIEDGFVVRDDAICVTPAAFWSVHPLRMSFLTAAVKMADMEEAIDFDRLQTTDDLAEYLIEIDDDSQYFRPTQDATRLFLSGHTSVHRSRKKPAGWVSVFQIYEEGDYRNNGTRAKEKAELILRKP
jgi:hypothetical protein